MNVTIIGTGNMGRGIGTRLAAGGHNITFIDIDPESVEEAVGVVSPAAQGGATVSAASLSDAALGEVVILAVWYGVNKQIAQELGDRLKGKVVVDIANPLNETFSGLATAPGSSSAEELAEVVAPGADVVKAFNTTFAGTLMAGEVAGQPLDVLIAGDDEAAKAKVSQLVEDGGMRAVDAGPLERARQLEGLGLMHILLQGTLQTNWASTFKILS